MTGRILVIAIAVTAIIAGIAMYWLQVYAFYDVLDADDVEIRVTEGSEVRPLDTPDLTAIDATSSPIRFRACFTAPSDVSGDVYADPTPLVAPSWFECFDAADIGAALEAGDAEAILGEENIEYGIDRVIAVYPDGRAFAWQQINACGREVFDGNPAPPGCPPQD